MDIVAIRQHMGTILMILFRLFLTGVAISIVNQIYVSKSPRLFFSLKKAYRRYFRLLGAWVIITLISSTAVTISAFAFGFLKSKISLISVEYLLTSLALAPFVFVLPSIVVENRKVYQSLNRSFSVFSRKRGAALLPAMLLSAAFLPIPYLSNAAYIVAITLATVGLAVLRNKYTYTRNEEAVHGQQA